MNAASIAAALRQDIAAGRLRPGAELMQQPLAERFQVSRIPIRDALALLAADGIVVAVPNRGARVLSLSVAEIEECYALRVLLECDCLAVAMARRTDAHVQAVRRVLERSNLDARTDGWSEGDWAFHAALYRPAERPQQMEMIGWLRRRCRVHLAVYQHLTQGTDQWLQDHAAIADAYAAGDVDQAVAALKGHLIRAGQWVVQAMVQAPSE